MKTEKYYIGLDIGTDSVGYAVTDENYNLCKFKGEPMWGTTLFDSAQPAAGRRNNRGARRRVDRRQQRVRLLMELFAPHIAGIDENFFKRIKESYLYPETPDDKVRLFDTFENQKEYVKDYPTIHHLIVELMNNDKSHDVRLVYLACAWLVAHRGHFLSEVDKTNIKEITNFEPVYNELVKFIESDPWNKDVDLANVAEALKSKDGIKKKEIELTKALFGGNKAPKTVDDKYKYNYELVIKLLCGGTTELKKLFAKEEYAELDKKSVTLNMNDEELAGIMQNLDEGDAELISKLKKVYDWSVLADILQGSATISEAKVKVYEQHKNDLKLLKKQLTKKYRPDKLKEIFCDKVQKANYVAYIGKNAKTASQEDFCKYIKSIFKGVTPEEQDKAKYDEMMKRLEACTFMPKQVNGDNRVIPYQLYWSELNKILENAKNYLPFLNESDQDGITVADKVLSVFEFRVPYYVGPLKEKSDKYNHWMERKVEGKIYPWNFADKVDLDKSEEAFIARMTNSCTYLPGEDVLPKSSLIYCAFEVLNEINNIKINNRDISVELKQEIYNNVFLNKKNKKVTPEKIKKDLESNNHIGKDDTLSGIDITVKSSLAPFIHFQELKERKLLTDADAEKIICRAAYSEDKARFSRWLKREYPNLPEDDVKYISGLKLKGFGRLSKKLLCGVDGTNRDTGEYYTSIIRAMWETNYNLNQLLSNRFTFKENIDELIKEYYSENPKNSIAERLDDMYISNSVKRPIIRTLDILNDVVKVQGGAPERIFIEMARGANEDQKGKRTKSRYEQLKELYEKTDQDLRELAEEREKELDERQITETELQRDQLFLYFIQLGKCMYSGETITLESIRNRDGKYNIEHIYPQSIVKDDSIINNLVLVKSEINDKKRDDYPIDVSIREKRRSWWEHLHKLKYISDEKYRRLTRNTGFTDEERYNFINRQLVETRQSTKALANLLKEKYPETEIVYVKAGLVSDFRRNFQDKLDGEEDYHEFDLPKSRAVNDLHHAKDAYLNIVAGNVWHCKYSKDFWRADDKANNAKAEVVFTHPVMCNGKTVWNGARDKERVIKIARKNTARVTKYAFCRKGELFDQQPRPKGKDLVPLKKGRPTEIYGGYNKPTVSGFVLVRYKKSKKTEVSLLPLRLMYMDRYMKDEAFRKRYIERELGAEDFEILLGGRILKINTVLSLDGVQYYIKGVSGSTVLIGNMMQFKTSFENEEYIKRLESFTNKNKKNPQIKLNEKYDKITKERNLALYDCFVEKMNKYPYNCRPNNPYKAVKAGRGKFETLEPEEQVKVLLAILGLFGRADEADLTDIGGGKHAGKASLNLNISNWQKNYTDVRIIDQSASGLFEERSENILAFFEQS